MKATLQLTTRAVLEHDLETCTKHSPFAHALIEVLHEAGGVEVEQCEAIGRAQKLLTDRGVPRADWLRKP